MKYMITPYRNVRRNSAPLLDREIDLSAVTFGLAFFGIALYFGVHVLAKILF